MILRVTHNIKLSSDMNLSIATEGVVDNTDEAEAMGNESAEYMGAYLRAFGDAFGGDEDEDDE